VLDRNLWLLFLFIVVYGELEGNAENVRGTAALVCRSRAPIHDILDGPYSKAIKGEVQENRLFQYQRARCSDYSPVIIGGLQGGGRTVLFLGTLASTIGLIPISGFVVGLAVVIAFHLLCSKEFTGLT